MVVFGSPKAAKFFTNFELQESFMQAVCTANRVNQVMYNFIF